MPGATLLITALTRTATRYASAVATPTKIPFTHHGLGSNVGTSAMSKASAAMTTGSGGDSGGGDSSVRRGRCGTLSVPRPTVS